MRESEYMVRNTNGTIDAHKSIHAFAMAIGRQLQEEAQVKSDRKIKNTILKVFKDNPGARLTHQYVVLAAARSMDPKDIPEYTAVIKRIELHIKLNSKKGGYLQAIQGANGGLFRRVQP